MPNKKSTRKGMINIRAELEEIESKLKMEWINSSNHNTKVSFLKTNKTDKPLAKLMGKKDTHI